MLLRIFTTFLLLVFISVSFFSFPYYSEAAITDVLSVPACEIYAATVGKIKDKLAKKARDKARAALEDEANEKINGAANSVTGGLLSRVPVDTDLLLKDTISDSGSDIQKTERDENCKDLVNRVILSTLKKRLLDRIADQTIRWIQNGEEPKFVTNTGDFLEDVANDAVGDLAQELGAGFLCKPFRLNIQLQLLKPSPFSERARCTLNDIVRNVEGFKNDFRSGGWIGYQELLKPQNNRWGAEILAIDEAQRRQADALQASQLRIIANQGFLGDTTCVDWSLIFLPTGSPTDYVTDGATYAFPVPDPDTTPELNKLLNKALSPTSPYVRVDAVANGGVPIPGVDYTLTQGRYNWKCESARTITPGRVAAEVLTKGITGEIDYLISADDLTEYLAAFGDAAITRITKELVDGGDGFGGRDTGVREGVANLFKGGDSPARGTTPAYNCASYKARDPRTGVLVETPISKACEQHEGSKLDIIRQGTENLAALLLEAVTAASSSEKDFKEATQLSNDLLALLGKEDGTTQNTLIQCLTSHSKTAEAEAAKALVVTTRDVTQPLLEQKVRDVGILLSDIGTTRRNLNDTSVQNPEYNRRVLDLHNSSYSLKGEALQYTENLTQIITSSQAQLDICKAP